MAPVTASTSLAKTTAPLAKHDVGTEMTVVVAVEEVGVSESSN